MKGRRIRGRSAKGRGTVRGGTTADCATLAFGGAALAFGGADSVPELAGCCSPIARRIPSPAGAGNGSDEQEFSDPPAGGVQARDTQRGQVRGPPQQTGT